MQAAQMLAELHGELAASGCRLQIVERGLPCAPGRRGSEGGDINRFTSVADAVEE